MEQVDTRYTLSRYIFIGVMTVDPASHSCSSVVDALNLPSAYVMWDTHVQCPGKQQSWRADNSGLHCDERVISPAVDVEGDSASREDRQLVLDMHVHLVPPSPSLCHACGEYSQDSTVPLSDWMERDIIVVVVTGNAERYDRTAPDLQTLVEQQASTIQTLQARLDAQENTLQQQAATIQTLQTSLATVDAHENKLQLQMTALNLLNNMLNAHDALIKQQAASLASLENSFQTEGSSVEDLRLSVTRHQMSIQSLTGSVDRLGNRVTTLEANSTWLANRLSVQEREVGFRVEMGLNRQGQHYNVHIAMNTPIKYDKVLENHGNGYSDTTGKFTAPYAGIYWFYTHFMATEQGGVELAIFSSSLGGWGRACMASSEDHDIDSNDMSSCSAILRLRQGEEVYVSLNHGAPYIWSAYAYFDGVLVSPE
ncbi:hypothetical protein BaRGS_00030009 [Batillaria attramentaria]|uniref:C1q domain-containing protein n=1 Tax=Batillaria attramentaria TaxID=370345 RepID=A0ABD0JW39_9CAEN